jgi:hypothetical protein
MARTVKALVAAAAIGAGIFAMPTAALATSSAGNHQYSIGGGVVVTALSSSTKTTFEIDVSCGLGTNVCEVGHGSVAKYGSSAWSLTVCDDRADGIGPYIDRDGGSYGTDGNGTCSMVVAIPEHWRVRWDGRVTPWFTMP